MKENKKLAGLLFVLAISSFSLYGQTPLHMELTYDKTGQLTFEYMPDQFSTFILYDNTGNRRRKNSQNQIISVLKDRLPETGIRLFPNPAKDHLVAEFYLASPGNIRYTIFSVDGNILYSEQQHSSQGKVSHVIGVSGLTAGSYIVRITFGDKTYNNLIVIK